MIAESDKMMWLGPTPEMLNDPLFEAIWQTIKTWDVNVPEAYSGYCGANGNHVRAIFEAARRLSAPAGDAEALEWRNCALYDAMMDGPKFIGWNRSALDHCRKQYIESAFSAPTKERPNDD